MTFVIAAFIQMNAGLVTGANALPGRVREFLVIDLFMMLLPLLLLPFFTTALLTRGRDSRRMRIFHLTAWLLAAGLGWLLVAVVPVMRSGRFWGLWLYIGVAVSALTLEVLGLVSGRKPRQSNGAA